MKKNTTMTSFQNKNNKFKSKEINLGIQVLRFLLSFWVVIIHCSLVKKEHKKYLYKHFHVPTFFFLSFYFYYPIISAKNINRILSRFQRLLLPYIFWPFFQLILIIKTSFEKFKLKNALIQLLIGSPIHFVFWFQFNLIFLTLFFTIIIFAFNKNGINILIFIELFCYYLSLSGLIYNLLKGYISFFRKNIGGLIEMIPMAVNGYIFKSKNLLLIANQYPISFNFFLFGLLFILFHYDIFLKKPGFRYPNVSLNIISSIILFLFFGTLTFKRIKNKAKIIINSITQFSGGIYYTHTIINAYLKKYSHLKRNYSYSLIIYIICFFICFFGNYLFKNYKLKYIFL